MSFTIEPVSFATLLLVLITAISGFVWIGRLSNRVDRLESDVKELKQGQARILELLNQHIGYHQGLDAVITPSSSNQ